MRLEDEGNIAFCWRFIVNTDSVQINCACFRCVQASDTAERCRFACPRLTEQHEEFLILDIKRDVVERDKVAESFCDVFEFYCRHKYSILPY